MYPVVWWLFCIGIIRALFSGIRANRHRAGFDLGRQGDWRAGRTCAYRSIILPRGRSRSAKATSKSICDSPKIKRVRFIIQVMPYRSVPFPDYPSWETQSRASQRPTLPNALPKRHQKHPFLLVRYFVRPVCGVDQARFGRSEGDEVYVGGQGWLGLYCPSFYNVRSRPIQIPGYGLLAPNQSHTPQHPRRESCLLFAPSSLVEQLEETHQPWARKWAAVQEAENVCERELRIRIWVW